MCILIENAEAAEFLTELGQWTKTPGDGFCFASTGAAYAVAIKQPIHKFNIVRFFSLNGQFIKLDHGNGIGNETRPVQPASPSQASALEVVRPELALKAYAG